MTRGALLFAHNSSAIDYGLMSIISGGLAKKHLGIPVSVVTDKWTIEWLKESKMFDKAVEVFDQIIEIEKPVTTNTRKLHDGFYSQTIPFENSNRCLAWDLSPYDQTLLIDSDYLIFSKSLNEYWDVDASVMIAKSMSDIKGDRAEILDTNVSETGIHMFWATTVMFDKSKESQFFFEVIKFIRDNYKYYGDLFRFNSKQYRNDIAFSIAKHILNGFETDYIYTLPSLTTILDKDIMHTVDADGKITVLVDNPENCGYFWATTLKNTDVHIMNKQSIIRNKEQLLELI